jgi:hypothetical protein
MNREVFVGSRPQNAMRLLVMLARAPSPTISLRESDSGTRAEWGLLDCFLLARNDPLSHIGRLVGSTPGPLACPAAVRERRRSREEGWVTLPE